MTAISPERLTDIRKLRGLGRPKLAKLSGLSERQLARLEGALPMKDAPSADMLTKLSDTLRVRPEAFSGTEPLTDADFDFTHGVSCSCC
ncbi:helix-turn-helix transcriptional regulator [Sagittula sp. NFXS13]|uniref:helix-turn-helix domain-containing protein n=1 Tax=Sagittula sp. NFXS13 TaxID=2819095 RepID=UPI0032DEE47C